MHISYGKAVPVLLAWVLGWGVATPVVSQGHEGRSSIDAARDLMAAFNAHDSAGMAKLVTDDFELYYVDDSGVSALAVQGPEQLSQEMTTYFAARPNVRSEIADSIPGTRFVAFREQIVGGDSSVAVYEILNGKVRRAWYYPAEPGG